MPTAILAWTSMQGADAVVPYDPFDGSGGTSSMQAAADATQANPLMGGNFVDIDPRDAAAHMAAQQRQAAVGAKPGENANYGQYQPKTQRVRTRQWIMDDWRWSKGTDQLRFFEEVALPKNLMKLAHKLLGEGSKYPARIADDTDCVAECTAWNTLLVRPRGTGAKVALAKRMLFEVLHPHAHEMREEALMTPEEMAQAAQEAKELDPSKIDLAGEDEVTKKMREGLTRRGHGKLYHVGIGGEGDAKDDVPVASKKSELVEMEILTPEDLELVRANLNNLRIAAGVTAVIGVGNVKLYGKPHQTDKARALITTLMATGEWVGLTDTFVAADETEEAKKKRRAVEGPAEQILLKVPEGPVSQKIEKNLKAMELAADADQIKMTSKAVQGKRTLMVEGTKAVHERVKQMVRELCEDGDSPMLSKALKGQAMSWQGKAGQVAADVPAVSFSAAFLPKPASAGAKPAATAAGNSSSSTSKPGVVEAGPVLTKPAAVDTAAAAAPKAAKPAAGVGMRRLPGPKLNMAAAVATVGDDLFASLPEPGAGPEAADDAAATVQGPPGPAVEGPAAGPPGPMAEPVVEAFAEGPRRPSLALDPITE
eukprot:TRINITY_DN25255_c0_g1_i2.p1 TRINITY_DN25255_c0_g1~~TRINITY_DN25255_c0_g1_i2.p1  ORF type:complete len:596 (-),score=153.60 TRINITY_DN25255_c0_g1_i2:36-1823(-)